MSFSLFEAHDLDGTQLRVGKLANAGDWLVGVTNTLQDNAATATAWLKAEHITELRAALAPFDPTKPTTAPAPPATLYGERDARRVKDYQEGFHAGARYRADRIAEGLPVAEGYDEIAAYQAAYPSTRAEAAKLAAALVSTPDADNVIRLAKWLLDEGQPALLPRR